MTWSPDNKIAGPSSSQQRWSPAWPGVWTARNEYDGPNTTVPSVAVVSGTKPSRRLEADHLGPGSSRPGRPHRGAWSGWVWVHEHPGDGGARPRRRRLHRGCAGLSGPGSTTASSPRPTRYVFGARPGHEPRVGCGEAVQGRGELVGAVRGPGRARSRQSGTATGPVVTRARVRDWRPGEMGPHRLVEITGVLGRLCRDGAVVARITRQQDPHPVAVGDHPGSITGMRPAAAAAARSSSLVAKRRSPSGCRWSGR